MFDEDMKKEKGELARPLSGPLRQVFLLCSQKLHEQLTVGC